VPTCPLENPYAYANGTRCCRYRGEGINTTLGRRNLYQLVYRV